MELACDPRHERLFSRSSTICFYNLHAEWRKRYTGQTENILVLIFWDYNSNGDFIQNEFIFQEQRLVINCTHTK